MAQGFLGAAFGSVGIVVNKNKTPDESDQLAARIPISSGKDLMDYGRGSP